MDTLLPVSQLSNILEVLAPLGDGRTQTPHQVPTEVVPGDTTGAEKVIREDPSLSMFPQYNSTSVLKYWHKYPTFKLSSISRSSALIVVHIIKYNFNSAYCPGFIVTHLRLTANVHVQEMQEVNNV